MTSSLYRSVGIVIGPHDNKAIVRKLRRLLLEKGLRVVHEPHDRGHKNDLSEHEHHASGEDDFAQQADLICCVGGDGTMLDAIARYYQHQKPFTGINLGHIGFLVDLRPDAIDSAFADLLTGDSCSEQRMLLKIEIARDDKTIACHAAANEVFFRNAQGASMIYLDVLINGQAVHTECGDGLLVSTPTGSTAYNLSNGGPILEPGVDAICLTPICPNYLNSRPVVIGSDAPIEIRVPGERRARILVGCDGQRELIMEEGDVAKVRKHELEWTLLHPQNYEYFALLRSKLKWGMGPSASGQARKP